MVLILIAIAIYYLRTRAWPAETFRERIKMWIRTLRQWLQYLNIMERTLFSLIALKKEKSHPSGKWRLKKKKDCMRIAHPTRGSGGTTWPCCARWKKRVINESTPRLHENTKSFSSYIFLDPEKNWRRSRNPSCRRVTAWKIVIVWI